MAEPLELAATEARQVRLDLEKLARDPLPVTVLLFQPAPPLGRGLLSGRLVDVGPRQPGWPDHEVWQPATAGATGAFVQDPSYSNGPIPRVQAITDDVVASYIAQAPLDVRKAQVALERARYPEFDWLEDRPPLGAFLHHLSLTPTAPNLDCPCLPSFGVGYVLTRNHQADRLVQRLAHCAQIAGSIALEKRRRRLLGQKRLKSLQPVSIGRPPVDSDPLHTLVARFLLYHHWFFPYEPLVAQAIDLLGATAETRYAVWSRVGAVPPSHHFESQISFEGIVDRLINHLLTIAADDYGRSPTQAVRNGLRSLVITLLFLLAGETQALEVSGNGLKARPLGEPLRKTDYLTRIPRTPPAGDWPVSLPVFEVERVQRAGRDESWREPALRQLKVDDTSDFAVRTWLRPTYIATSVRARDGRVGLDDMPVDGELKTHRWLTHYTRFLIMSDLEAR